MSDTETSEGCLQNPYAFDNTIEVDENNIESKKGKHGPRHE